MTKFGGCMALGVVIGFGAIAARAAADAPPAPAASAGAPSVAASTATRADTARLFPRLPQLASAQRFWEQVFAKYSENQSLIHDGDDPARIYEIVDLRDDAQRLSPVAFERLRARREQQASAEVIEALQALAKHDGNAAGLGALAQRVRALFPAHADAARFRRAADAVRVQRGVRERTAHALSVATAYWPSMEKIFAGYGLPTQLTRLPLVESSFNVDAYSKAGAAGIWQFIPSSARLYMTLDAVQDDRRDPWTSTDAAARHLRDDYQALGSWPLAITAYNYGRSGLLRALQQVHGTTLADLLQRFDSPRFGFATRNFYAEFLAALEVQRHAAQLFGDVPQRTPITFEVVHTRDYLAYGTLRTLAGTDAASFRRLNPSFEPAVVEGRLYVPPGTAVRVPPGAATRFHTLYAALDPSLRFAHQRSWFVAYRVRRGDVLGRIAVRHHVSVQALLRANDLRSPRLIRVGQVLRIPTGGARAAAHAIAVAAHPRTQPTRADYFVHRVHRGQTLSGIAHRYRVSISDLLQLNGLRDADLVRIGMALKIPRSE